MESKRYLSFFLVVSMCFLGSSQALYFFVGGKDGWVLKPSEGYDHWAKRNRFQVNDKLFFKYKKGSDSVLVVDKDDFQNCHKAKPIQTLEDGDSVFKFDRSGSFFFISGHGDHCEKGQKLIIEVLGVGHATHKAPFTTPAAPAPAPATPSPAVGSPKAESPVSTAGTGASPVFGAPAPAPSGAAAVGGSVGFVGVALGFFFGLVLVPNLG